MDINLSDSVEIKKVSEKGNIGIFDIEGLYPGYGVTVGNSLRRALLSSLPGAAITQIRIKSVDHEFSTLPGMVEDMVEFVLNLKRVRFRMLTDEPQTVTLKAKGVKEVSAGDITGNAFLEVINPDFHIASLTKKTSNLDMEIVVENGLGYLPSDERKLGRLPVGTIVLDAIFSPMAGVNFKVENMRVGDRIDYNRIKLEIETDGSIVPTDALYEAANILQDHFGKIRDAFPAPAGEK